MKDKKILLALDNINTKGGLEKVVLNLANSFNELGAKVDILNYTKSLDSNLNLDKNIQLRYLSITKPIHFRLKILNKLQKALFALSLNIKLFFICKDYDIFIENSHLFYPHLKAKNTLYIKIMHNILSNAKPKNIKRLQKFNYLVALSSSEHLRLSGFTKTYLIPNFLESSPKIKANMSLKAVISIGRINKEDEKGFFKLIKIFSKITSLEAYKSWSLILVIDDLSFKDLLINLAKDLGLNNLYIHPFKKDVKEHYLQASIYASASKVESFGMSILEAFSFGLSVVAYKNDGANFLIKDGVNGFLVDQDNEDLFILKLKELMDSYILREEMKQSCILESKSYLKERILCLYIDLFKKLDKNPNNK